jgi:hypothetical protein
MQMKKPAWSAMPVLDVRALKPAQLKALATAYDKLSTQVLAPIAQLDCDLARQAIDAALMKELGFADLQPIRELLAREPGLSAVDINPRAGVENDDDHGEDEDQTLFQA